MAQSAVSMHAKVSLEVSIFFEPSQSVVLLAILSTANDTRRKEEFQTEGETNRGRDSEKENKKYCLYFN